MSAQSKLKAESRWHQKIFAVISAATAVPQSKAALSSPACIVEPGISQDFLEIHLFFFFYVIFHLAETSASTRSINSHIVAKKEIYFLLLLFSVIPLYAAAANVIRLV